MAHQLHLEAEPVHDKSGMLWKKSKLGFSWNRRYVRAHNGVLEVRNRPNDSNCKMSIPLEYASIASRPAAGRGQYRIEIVTALHARYQFAAVNSRDGNEWLQSMRWQASPSQRRSRPGANHKPNDSHQWQTQNENSLAPSSAYDLPHHQVPEATEGPFIEGENGDTELSVTKELPEASWNESYQSILEMEEHTFNMSVSKTKQLNALVGEFVSTAVRVGKTIIDEFTLPPHLKSIAPLDQQDQNPEDETFLCEGIVMQYMHDPLGSIESDELKRKMATHDLHGISALGNAALASSRKRSGLHTYLCCLIDYMGFRLFALALVPIYDDSRLAVGVVDGLVRAERDAEALLEQAAVILNLRAHNMHLCPSLEDKPADATLVHTSASVQVHRGEDARLYATNLSQLMPEDRHPAPPPRNHALHTDEDAFHSSRRLRHELVRHYRRPLSSDAYSKDVLSSEALECDSDAARASKQLRGRVLPEFVKQLNMLAIEPIDSSHLCSLMHAAGINMRCLGSIAELTLLPHIREIAVVEMVARAAKQILARNLRRLLRTSSSSRQQQPDAAADPHDHSLNHKHRQIAKQIRHEQELGIVQFFNLLLFPTSRESVKVWRGVLHDIVYDKFDYELSWQEAQRLHKPLLCAALQFHAGVRFRDVGAALNFDDDGDAAAAATTSGNVNKLKVQDLIAVQPRAKYSHIQALKCLEYPGNADAYMSRHEWAMAIQALKLKLDLMVEERRPGAQVGSHSSIESSSAAKPQPAAERNKHDWHWTQGGEYQRTLNELCEANIRKGDMGAARAYAKQALEASPGLDGNTAITYRHLVSIYRAQRQDELASRSYRLSLSILRRLYGPHSPLILHLHDEIGTRYLEAHQPELAEKSFLQAIQLASTALGKSHPTTAQFYSRLGNVYHLGMQLDRAKDAHEKACLIYEGLYGAASLEVARSCFYLSDILTLKGDLNTARYYNQRALKIRLQLLGEEHPLTLDSYHQVAWQAHRREDHQEAVPYFEKLLLHFKSIAEPDDELLVDIKKMTKAVIRLQMRSLPMDQVAFLDKLYQSSLERHEEHSALTRMVIRKLYDESPSKYIKELVCKSCKGVAEPGYTSSTAELAVILRLMEEADSDSDGGSDAHQRQQQQQQQQEQEQQREGDGSPRRSRRSSPSRSCSELSETLSYAIKGGGGELLNKTLSLVPPPEPLLRHRHRHAANGGEGDVNVSASAASMPFMQHKNTIVRS